MQRHLDLTSAWIFLLQVMAGIFALPSREPPDEISLLGQIPPSQFKSLVNGNVSGLSQRNDTIITSRHPHSPAPKPSVYPMKSVSGGAAWQHGIDMYDNVVIRSLAHVCDLSTDLHAFLSEPFVRLVGPLQLRDGRNIFYYVDFKRGVYYPDIVNIFEWGILNNYHVAKSFGIHNVWADWDFTAVSNTGVATPWLRTDLWFWRGWSMATDPRHSDMTIIIFTTPPALKDPQAAMETLSYPAEWRAAASSTLTGLQRAPVCLPNLWSTPIPAPGGGDTSNLQTAEQMNQSWPLATKNMNISPGASQPIVAAMEQQNRVDAVWLSGGLVQGPPSVNSTDTHSWKVTSKNGVLGF